MTMSGGKDKKESDKKLQDVRGKLRKSQAELDKKNAVVTALNQAKAFHPEMLGHGKKYGGTSQHKKQRRDALDRVRRLSTLSPEQEGQYELFAEAWDTEMRGIHSDRWGELFMAILTKVLNDMMNGEPNAFSIFMRNEIDRTLGHVRALFTPGMEMLID